jgi:hypothetical protein
LAPPHSAPAKLRAALPAAAVAALVMAGCGGGTRQDAGERSASYRVDVVKASFPAQQSIARPEQMELEVKNEGSRRIPSLAITVDSFQYRSSYPGLADPRRPIWAIEEGPGPAANPAVNTQEVSKPGGGQTAYVNTWSLGSLAPGATHIYVWKVVPVVSGEHVVHYSVAAGLAGKASAVSSSGGKVQGSFTIQIAGEPPATHVDAATGKVVPGSYP